MADFDETHAPKPWVQVAIFCQTAIIEQNTGSMSIIKNVDGVTVPGPTPEMEPTPVRLTLALILKSGEMKGQYSVSVRCISPSEEKTDGPPMPVYFEGGDRGLQTVMPIGLIVNETGTYWFDVLVGDQILTRIPMRIMYQHVPQQGIQDYSGPR